MKRKYDTSFRKHFTNDIVIIGVFILAVICGSIYALYIKDKDSAVFLMLNNYILLDMKQTFKMDKFINGFYDYFKQLLAIWLFGFFNFTLPISIIVLFIMVFSYAFTTTCTILVYGLKGLAVAFFTYGIQAIIMLTIGMYLVIASLRKKNVKTSHILSEHSLGIVPVIVGSCIVGVLDILTATNLHYITNIMLKF